MRSTQQIRNERRAIAIKVLEDLLGEEYVQENRGRLILKLADMTGDYEITRIEDYIR